MTGTAGSLPKNTGDTIYGADYNAVQTKIRGVLGDGNGYTSNYGYGQGLSSGQVAATAVIDHTQWGYLFSDINTAYTHQNGVAYSATNPSAGLTISHNDLNAFSSACDTLLTNRLTVNAGQLTGPTQIAQPTNSGAWGYGGSGINSTVNIALGGSVRNAQYFFNQGGKIRINGYYAYGSATTQNNQWNAQMAATLKDIDYTVYNAIVAGGNSYTQIYYTAAFTGSYTANYITMNAKTPDGGASIDVYILYEDDHPSTWQDGVDGTIGATFSRYTASGAFTGIQPTATITANFAGGVNQPAPVFSVGSLGGATSVNEGSSLTFSTGGSNIADGTYYWSINNITTTDGRFSAASGSFTITGNAGSFSVSPLANNYTDGATTFSVSIRTGSTSGTIVATSGAITVNDTSQSTYPLLWGDTGTTSHPDIAVGGGTYNSPYASWDIDTGGGVYLNVPTDAGGNPFSDTFVAGGSTAGYRVRVYNSSVYAISDPNNSPVSPNSWSGYFYITTARSFGLYPAAFLGTIEFSNSDNSQIMSLNFSGYVSVYA